MARAKRPATDSDWKHLATTGALFAGVLGTLMLGAVLQVDADHPAAVRRSSASLAQPLPASEEGPRTPAADSPSSAPSSPESGPVLPFDGGGDLVDRAAYDERRLQASGRGYTLQFAINCETKNVRANLDILKQYQDFYLLTMLYQDRACFRLCWGFYDNERQARADRDIPEVLTAITAEPKVISIEEALP
jgi:hypothetical protein